MKSSSCGIKEANSLSQGVDLIDSVTWKIKGQAAHRALCNVELYVRLIQRHSMSFASFNDGLPRLVGEVGV
jgi:hypothetical protein